MGKILKSSIQKDNLDIDQLQGYILDLQEEKDIHHIEGKTFFGLKMFILIEEVIIADTLLQDQMTDIEEDDKVGIQDIADQEAEVIDVRKDILLEG